VTRDDLLEALQPELEQLADKILAIAGDIAGRLLRERLQALATNLGQGGGTVDAPRFDEVPRKGQRKANAGRPRSAALARRAGSSPAPDTKKKRKPNSCNKCGAVGFTSATCGKTHNVEASSTDSDNPPPTATRADRFSRIEAAASARRIASS
jgi:hypothetical protein